jgi:hypothetical protein
MGLMPANQMRDPASIAAYNLIPAESKVRTPSADNSQHSFKSLLVIMTPQPLTNSEVSNFNAGATLLCRTDNPSQGTNFKKMTKGLGTLTVGDLDKSIR